MPRHVKTKAKVGKQAVKRGRPKGEGWRKVSRVSVESAALIEVPPTHLVWRGPDDKPDGWLPVCSNMFRTEGAIVKIVPPPGTPDSHLLSLERSFYEGGAKSVKVMPSQEEVRVVIDDDIEFNAPEITDTRSLRQVALDRVERTTNAHDQDALRALVTEAMDYAESQ